MLDKLHLHTAGTCNLDLIERRLGQHLCNVAQLNSDYYRDSRAFYRELQNGQHQLFLIARSGPQFQCRDHVRIELNPSNFPDYRNLLQTLTQVAPLDSYSVNRVDHTVDVPISVKRAFNAVCWPRKKLVRDWNMGELTGFHLGKLPEHLSVYDKAKQAALPGPLTRFELQQTKQKVAVRTLTELPRLLELNPFEGIRFLALKPIWPTCTFRERQTWDSLDRSIYHDGLQNVFKQLNRHGNFKRDYSRYFEADNRFPDLGSIYRENLCRYGVADFISDERMNFELAELVH